jgi:hypothetical protein
MSRGGQCRRRRTGALSAWPTVLSHAAAPLCLVVALFGGCATGSAPSTGGPSSGANDAAGNTGRGEPAARLDEKVQGRIVFVNAALRCVVMDFPIRRVPATEQRLGVYRDHRKVGEVKVAPPVLDTLTAGDVMAGEALVGDEVREE